MVLYVGFAQTSKENKNSNVSNVELNLDSANIVPLIALVVALQCLECISDWCVYCPIPPMHQERSRNGNKMCHRSQSVMLYDVPISVVGGRSDTVLFQWTVSENADATCERSGITGSSMSSCPLAKPSCLGSAWLVQPKPCAHTEKSRGCFVRCACINAIPRPRMTYT